MKLYDHRTLKEIEGNVDERKIEYSECINIINKLSFNWDKFLNFLIKIYTNNISNDTI